MKFVENNYEKVDKLLDIRDSAQARLKATEKEVIADQEVRSFVLLNNISAHS